MSGGTPLAIYDFDGTMISGDSIVAYLRFAHARKALTLRELCAAAAAGLLSRLGLLSAGEAKRRALRFLERLTPEAQTALDRDFAELLLRRLRPDAICQMAQDQAAGRLILLLSASTENYMAPLAGRIGVGGLICTRSNHIQSLLQSADSACRFHLSPISNYLTHQSNIFHGCTAVGKTG